MATMSEMTPQIQSRLSALSGPPRDSRTARERSCHPFRIRVTARVRAMWGVWERRAMAAVSVGEVGWAAWVVDVEAMVVVVRGVERESVGCRFFFFFFRGYFVLRGFNA